MREPEEIEKEMLDIEREIKGLQKEAKFCPYCEAELKGSDYVRTNKQIAIKYKTANIKNTIGYCTICHELIFPDDYSVYLTKPWKDPDSIYCATKCLEKVSGKNIASKN